MAPIVIVIAATGYNSVVEVEKTPTRFIDNQPQHVEEEVKEGFRVVFHQAPRTPDLNKVFDVIAVKLREELEAKRLTSLEFQWVFAPWCTSYGISIVVREEEYAHAYTAASVAFKALSGSPSAP